VLVIGGDITSLIAALFLARKMRNVSIILDEKQEQDGFEITNITDPENNKYHFKYQRDNIITSLESGLLYKYLEVLGLNNDLKGIKSEYEMIIELDDSVRKRFHSFEQFRVYLVRYYPKQRDNIHRFFKDLERHYLNFVTQQESMLVNTDYTLTSLMIEWGDYSLNDLLEKYFTDLELVNEFILNNQVNGLEPESINSYNFFMNYFLGLKHGFYYLNQSIDEIRKLLISKLLIINPNIFQKRKIKHYIYDESKKVTHLIDSENKEVTAKYFVINQNPKQFYQTYFSDFTEEIDTISKFYPNLDSTQMVNTLYIALNQKPQNIGMIEKSYFFKNDSQSKGKIIRLYNYKLFGKDSSSAKSGTICLDYTYDNENPTTQDELLKRLYKVFPKMKKTIVGIREGKPRQYLSMLSEMSVRKGLSINEQIAIEAAEHIQIVDNLYVTGKWLRPEAGIFGVIHSGIVMGDKIEERLYYGEDDDSFYYLTNDEIMMMIRHNYGKILLGNSEIHVNFHVGKSNYFVRTKGKNITLHHGVYSNPDLSIYTTNDKLSNLLLKKTTFEEVLKQGGLKYTGSTELLYQAIPAFNLDDYEEYDNSYQAQNKIKYLGVKFLFAHLLVFSIVAFLSNYLNMIWLIPFAFGLSILITLLKFRIFHKISWFEYLMNFIYLTTLFMAIFWPAFNQLKSDDPFLGIIGFVFLISGMISKPIVYDFHQFDYRKDYANTVLFKVINNGLTLVWALIFLGILGGTYVTGERYVSVLYNLVFLGIFLTYYYPIMYIKTNIKK